MMQHDSYIVMERFLHMLDPDMAITDRLEDVYTNKNTLAMTHTLVPQNRFFQMTVLINQDHDNKELLSFINAAELTKSRLCPLVLIPQSRMVNNIEQEYIAQYRIKFDILDDSIVGLEAPDGMYVTPHSLNININITKLKEEL